jgi:hypothetical protein
MRVIEVRYNRIEQIVKAVEQYSSASFPIEVNTLTSTNKDLTFIACQDINNICLFKYVVNDLVPHTIQMTKKFVLDVTEVM